jgi:hypothetical protein
MRVAFLTLLLFALLAGVASAARSASVEEAAAVAAGLDGARGECGDVTMSTVDGTWALALAKDVEGCEFDIVSDKLHVMHLAAGGAWTEFAELDFPTGCPEGAPPAVAADLGFCKKQRGYMVCANRRATAIHREFDRPRTCNTLRPHQPFADAVNLAKLRWSGWGKATATARGIDRGFRKKDRDTAVTVRASGRTVGCKGDWVYTILRVHSRYGTDVVLQPTACP